MHNIIIFEILSNHRICKFRFTKTILAIYLFKIFKFFSRKIILLLINIRGLPSLIGSLLLTIITTPLIIVRNVIAAFINIFYFLIKLVWILLITWILKNWWFIIIWRLVFILRSSLNRWISYPIIVLLLLLNNFILIKFAWRFIIILIISLFLIIFLWLDTHYSYGWLTSWWGITRIIFCILCCHELLWD